MLLQSPKTVTPALNPFHSIHFLYFCLYYINISVIFLMLSINFIVTQSTSFLHPFYPIPSSPPSLKFHCFLLKLSKKFFIHIMHTHTVRHRDKQRNLCFYHMFLLTYLLYIHRENGKWFEEVLCTFMYSFFAPWHWGIELIWEIILSISKWVKFSKYASRTLK